ncbi:tetratricopeptide repeat protein [Kitasatospora sp. NPDC001683]
MQQLVRAENGFAYGAVGASIHVFGDGVPLYVLENWRPEPQADPEYLRELPSRMLNSRFAVVPFTGREAELAELRRWRAAGPRLSVRWLHAPGGQGKTRMAALFAGESRADGWKVVSAVHGPGTVLPQPGSQDLRLDGAAGLLLVVDYADRWPLTHLTWLLSNALLHQSATPTRVLMLARGAEAWPAIRAALAEHQAATSSQYLAPLPGDGQESSEARREMFGAARDSFAARYAVPAIGIGAPGPLSGPDFGLTLALHIAALVAVDAHVAGLRPPRDMAGLTIYLLDREHLHWARHYGDTGHELGSAERTFVTPPEAMNRTVFAAALTGPLDRPTGRVVLGALRPHPSLPGERILADHAVCYPPSMPARDTVLEPLYPDRLAEDFLALTVPGHSADYPARSWAVPTADTLLGRDSGSRPPEWTPRAVTFLAAAAERWPHLGPAYLEPLLRADPQLALAAGSAALTALANIPMLDPAVLAAVEEHFPDGQHSVLDPGIAAITERLTRHRLAATDDPERHALLYGTLARRRMHAGLHAQAAAATERAVQLWRQLAETNPHPYQANVGIELSNLGNLLLATGREEEAAAAAEEAVAILRPLSRDFPALYEADLAGSLLKLSLYLIAMGRRSQATTAAEEVVNLYQRLSADDPVRFESRRARSLDNLAFCWSTTGRHVEAVAVAEQAVAAWRRLADGNPAGYDSDLLGSLFTFSGCLVNVGRLEEGVAAAEESVTISRRLAQSKPAVGERGLVSGLSQYGALLSRVGRREEAVAVAEEAVELCRRFAEANPAAYERELGRALTHLVLCLTALGRREEALVAGREAVATFRQLAHGNPENYDPLLGMALSDLSFCLTWVGRRDEALAAAEEAVAIHRRLARANPAADEVFLALALSNLAGALVKRGREPEATTTAEEAVTIYRRQTAETLAPREHELASALRVLGACRRQAGRHAEALAAADEAVTICRRLAAGNAAAHESDLARALSDLGAYHAMLGHGAEAVAAAQEALSVRQRLARANPTAFAADLATSMANLGFYQAGIGRYEEALTSTERAVTSYRRLVAGDRAAYEPELARCLSLSASIRGRRPQGLQSALRELEEAVAIYRGLATKLPEAFEGQLRQCLLMEAVVLDGLGRRQQATAIRRALTGDSDR